MYSFTITPIFSVMLITDERFYFQTHMSVAANFHVPPDEKLCSESVMADCFLVPNL
jgi:hypothetical protein